MIIVNVCLPCSINGSLIDFETTGLNNKTGELVTCGVLTEKGISIHQRICETNKEFTTYVKDVVSKLKPPLYAFNREFEEGFCEIPVSCNIQFYKESTIYALKSEGLLSLYDMLSDSLSGSEVPIFWRGFKTLREPLFLSKIIRHNYCCLVKEYYLKLVRFDKMSVLDIKPLINSMLIEKKWIKPKLENIALVFEKEYNLLK